MPDTITPNLDLIKPEITGSPETWGNKLNADMDKLDVWATNDRQANLSGLQTGADATPLVKFDGSTVLLDDESFRVAAKPLFYADALDIVPITDPTVSGYRPGCLVTIALVRSLIDQLLPVRSIITWGGVETDIPDGWLMCDGRPFPAGSPLTGNGPDLRGRMILGGYLEAQNPPGGDTQKIGHGSGTAGVFNHTHPVTVNDWILNRFQIPGHSHALIGTGATGAYIGPSSAGTYELVAGNDVRTLGGGLGNVAASGDGSGPAAGHNHTATSSSNTSPGIPWWALAFIMKVKNFAG